MSFKWFSLRISQLLFFVLHLILLCHESPAAIVNEWLYPIDAWECEQTKK